MKQVQKVCRETSSKKWSCYYLVTIMAKRRDIKEEQKMFYNIKIPVFTTRILDEKHGLFPDISVSEYKRKVNFKGVGTKQVLRESPLCVADACEFLEKLIE